LKYRNSEWKTPNELSRSTIIKIPVNNFSNKFQFIINGFSEDGLLFNTVYKTGSTGF